jgi:hypothetical protein
MIVYFNYQSFTKQEVRNLNFILVYARPRPGQTKTPKDRKVFGGLSWGN